MEVDPLSIGLVASTAALALLSKSRSPPSPKDTNPRQLLRGPLADASDTHPLILAEQSDIATLRYPGRTAVYRSKHTPGDLPLGKRPRGTAKTIWEAFQQGREASRQHGSTRYLGKRERRRGPSSHGDTSDDTLETLDRTFTWVSPFSRFNLILTLSSLYLFLSPPLPSPLLPSPSLPLSSSPTRNPMIK